MLLVDSNAWADFFNDVSTPHTRRLGGALDAEEDIAVVPIIVTEVLQGFRTDTGFTKARQLLVALPVIQPTLECHVRAARLFRSLRSRGVTVRGAVDCIIAQVCLETDSELLSPDADFERIARHTRLRLWRDAQAP
jgi:hypothetical protein